ncbi:MAG: sugar phosphate isomerase/epimerase [Bacteroidales bacterium]|nr:sugar phosphate isomerase/epimerase [Bacteroidales bacterium]
MKNKRNLTPTLTGVILISLFLGLISCTQPKEQKYIGLQLWSVRDTIKQDPIKAIEAIGAMGYKFVEAANYANGQFYGMEPDSFKTLLNKNGLDFLGSHTGQPVPDSATWDSVMTWWDQCIDAHAKAGVQFLVQPSMISEAYENMDVLKRYCEYFNVIGEKCNAKGIRFGYHNHSREFTQIDSVTIYDYMLQNTDPEKVMFEMDLYWIQEGGANAIDYFNQYPGRFELWHVKDEAELGASGKMDFQPIFENAELAGMKYIIVEVEKYNFNALESVKLSLDFLNNAAYVK